MLECGIARRCDNGSKLPRIKSVLLMAISHGNEWWSTGKVTQKRKSNASNWIEQLDDLVDRLHYNSDANIILWADIMDYLLF